MLLKEKQDMLINNDCIVAEYEHSKKVCDFVPSV